MPSFSWPTVVISGPRLTTPPAVADRIAGLVSGAVLVSLPTAGHSILDTREPAALQILTEVCAGRIERLSGQGEELDRLPVRPGLWLMGSAIEVAARIEAVLPVALPRLLPRLLRSTTS